MASRMTTISFGSHSTVTIQLDRDGVETKVKIIPENKDGTVLVISEKDEENFLYDIQQVLMRYYI